MLILPSRAEIASDLCTLSAFPACNPRGNVSETATERLQRAFAEASKLPQEEQELLAKRILAELESDRRWTKVY